MSHIYMKQKHGFTLVEAMFSLFILAVASLGLIKALITTQYTAEDNLYEATALTVALSTIEQMKGASLSALSDPLTVSGVETFNLIAGNGSTTSLDLDTQNIIEIPIITKEDGTSKKTLPLTLTPRIKQTSSKTGYWLEVEYAYDHPRNGRTRTQTIRNMRSEIAVY